jgi:hypothetical protein
VACRNLIVVSAYRICCLSIVSYSYRSLLLSYWLSDGETASLIFVFTVALCRGLRCCISYSYPWLGCPDHCPWFAGVLLIFLILLTVVKSMFLCRLSWGSVFLILLDWLWLICCRCRPALRLLHWHVMRGLRSESCFVLPCFCLILWFDCYRITRLLFILGGRGGILVTFCLIFARWCEGEGQDPVQTLLDFAWFLLFFW